MRIKQMAQIARVEVALKLVVLICIFVISLISVGISEETNISEVSATTEGEEYLAVNIDMLSIPIVSLENFKANEESSEVEPETWETVQETTVEEPQTQEVVEEVTTQEVVEEVTTQEQVTMVDSYTDEDLYWLSKIIMAEGEGASYRYKVCVGLVIMNRVNSPQFPNTIYEVISSPDQYSSMTNGRINLEPNEDSVRAAREILSGTAEYSVPEDVVFQSKSELEGSGNWDIIDGDYFNYRNYR